MLPGFCSPDGKGSTGLASGFGVRDLVWVCRRKATKRECPFLLITWLRKMLEGCHHVQPILKDWGAVFHRMLCLPPYRGYWGGVFVCRQGICTRRPRATLGIILWHCIPCLRQDFSLSGTCSLGWTVSKPKCHKCVSGCHHSLALLFLFLLFFFLLSMQEGLNM